MHYIERGYRGSFPDSLRQCVAASFKMVVFLHTGTRLSGAPDHFIFLPRFLGHAPFKMGCAVGPGTAARF